MNIKSARKPLITGSAADFLPPRPTLTAMRSAVQGCRGCALYLHATQAVFGEGPRNAELMLVGEEPGDREDIEGHPFVGPAGKLLDSALEAAGIDRTRVYLTNAVKHFKFSRVELHKRRLHKPPTRAEVKACMPWLAQEIKAVRPELIVALGSTAAKALLGPGFLVTRHRGKVVDSAWGPVLPTVHPAAVLRARTPDREEARTAFFHDLEAVRALNR
jgi:uracil-DNA glycosylase family protein